MPLYSDLKTSKIQESGGDIGGNIQVAGSVQADSFSYTSTGAPSITSASTITLDAPDGVVVQNGPLRLPLFTAGQITAMTPLTGDLVFNTDTGQAQYYNGSSWVAI